MQICSETKDGHAPTVCTDTQVCVCVCVLKMEASSSAQEEIFLY